MSAGFVFNYLLCYPGLFLFLFLFYARGVSVVAFLLFLVSPQFGWCLFCARISSYLVCLHAVPWPFIVGGAVEIRSV